MKLYSLILSRTITIVGSSYLKAENIKKGVKIFNVTGTLDYAEYFTGTAESMLSRWFVVIHPEDEEEGRKVCKFVTNGTSLGLSKTNALAITHWSASTNNQICIRIPSFKDYHDIPTGNEFKIWIETPYYRDESNRPYIHMWYWQIKKLYHGTPLDEYPIGSTQSVTYSNLMALMQVTYTYSQSNLQPKTEIELSNRTITTEGSFIEDPNSDNRFSGYVGISAPMNFGELYITKMTFHST